MAFSPHVVTVIGAPGSGVTSLVSSLGQMLELYDTVSHKDTGAIVMGRHHRLARHFRDMMAAQRRVLESDRGTVLDGCLEYELCLIDLDLKHGRITHDEARVLYRFGAALLERLPAPDVVIHLDTTPAACLARCATREGLALEDIAEVDASVRAMAAAASDKGSSEVFVRKWDTFGKATAVRDTILCASPPAGGKRRLSRGGKQPSPSAVERLLRDAWAASQPAGFNSPGSRSRQSSLDSLPPGLVGPIHSPAGGASPETSRRASPAVAPTGGSSTTSSTSPSTASASASDSAASRATSPAPPTSPAAPSTPTDARHRPRSSTRLISGVFASLETGRDGDGNEVSLSQCDSPSEGSPACILTRLEDMPTLSQPTA